VLDIELVLSTVGVVANGAQTPAGLAGIGAFTLGEVDPLEALANE
jgi:hypothetical protein